MLRKRFNSFCNVQFISALSAFFIVCTFLSCGMSGSHSSSQESSSDANQNAENQDGDSESSDEMTCPLCNGERMVTMQGQTNKCPICDAKGSITQARNKEVSEKQFDCPMCDNGVVTQFGTTCTVCGGQGVVTALSFAQAMMDAPASGGGSDGGNPGGGNSNGNRTGCPHCGGAGAENVAGTGICKSCHGTGQTSGYGVELSACNQCDQIVNGKGNGKCKWCHGTGWR